MTDPMQEILYGTPDLTPEEEQQIMLQAEQSAQDMQVMESMAQQQALQPETAPTTESQQVSQQPAQPTGTEQAPPEEEGDRNIFQQAFDVLASPGQGVNDFFVDSINILPGVELKKRPKFENDVTQSIREISSIVLPTVFLTKGATGVANLGASASRVKMLSDPLVKFLGEKSLAAGIGAGVDYVVELNQTDDNLTGTLKKNFPATFGWIPDNVATLDSDSPDIKRLKNVNEGLGLGLFVDIVEGMAKVVKGIRGINRATQWVPESEKAKNWFKKNAATETTDDIEEAIAESSARRSDALDELGEYNFSKNQNLDEPMLGVHDLDDIEEAIAESSARRSDALDELGEYNFSKNQNLDEPMLGVHDLYGYEESGVRSVDDLGVVGASVDYARIANNIDSSYGRVGSVVTEPALKYGLEVSGGQEVIIRGITEQLQDADEYGYKTASGKYLSFKEISDAGEALAMAFYRMDTPQLKEAIKKWQGMDVDTGAPVLKSEAYAGVFKTIKKLMDDYVNMDVMKAQAYVGTSFAGQVSDMAQGARLMDGTASVDRAQEQILDRLEYLMAQKGMTSYSRGRALNMLNLWNRMTVKGSDASNAAYAKRVQNTLKNEKNSTLKAIERIKAEAKQTINTLREVKAERPELLAPLMMAYEFTDGNVDTITRLNNYVRNSTGVLSKALFDGQPDIPSVVMKGFYSNLYNSTLSAVGTPIKAGLSNVALLAERPISQAAGAIINGDVKTLRRGWYQYSAAWETLTKGFGYMNQVFKRSASDPFVMTLREDAGIADERQLQILRSIADAAAQRDEYGPQVMMSFIEEQNDLAMHPWLRFGQRGMQAFDGFTQAVIGNWEARGRAWDEVTSGGAKALDSESADMLAKKVYSEMFDENDTITDTAVRFTSGEISMSLDL